MDKYVFLVFLLAPGFVACTVGFMLHDFADKQNDLKIVMRYFGYSFFILPIALFICALTGVIPWNTILNSEIQLTAGTLTGLYFIVILVSVAVGIVWPIFLRQKILNIANKINVRRGLNEVFTASRLFDDFFIDGKDHFLVIERAGKVIAMGMYGGISAPENDKTEIALYTDADYQKEFESAQKSKDDHPLKHCKTFYISLEDDLIIREYDFPSEWSN